MEEIPTFVWVDRFLYAINKMHYVLGKIFYNELIALIFLHILFRLSI